MGPTLGGHSHSHHRSRSRSGWAREALLAGLVRYSQSQSHHGKRVSWGLGPAPLEARCCLHRPHSAPAAWEGPGVVPLPPLTTPPPPRAPQLLSESQGHMAHLVNLVSDVLDALHRDRGLSRPRVKADLQRAPARGSRPRGCANGEWGEGPPSLGDLVPSSGPPHHPPLATQIRKQAPFAKDLLLPAAPGAPAAPSAEPSPSPTRGPLCPFSR